MQDLSLQSLQWLESRGLYDNNATRQEKNNRRASLPEQIQANGYYRSVIDFFVVCLMWGLPFMHFSHLAYLNGCLHRNSDASKAAGYSS